MAAKPWKCRMPGCGEMNYPDDEFRTVGRNICSKCNHWRYLPHSIGIGGVGVLALVIGAVVWLVGMPERTYREKYIRYLQNDNRIDAEERSELAKLAERYKLSKEEIGQIELELGKGEGRSKEEGSARSPKSSWDPYTERRFSQLLRGIYRDGVKELDEQRRIDDFLREHPLPSDRLAQLEQEVKDRMIQSQVSLKNCLVYVAQKEYQAAVKECRYSTDHDPENDYAWANLCAAHAALRQDDQARAACNEALRLNPDNWLAHYNLASLHARRNERAEALDRLSKALASVVHDPNMTKGELKRHMQTDPDLRGLRNDPRFRQLLAIN